MVQERTLTWTQGERYCRRFEFEDAAGAAINVASDLFRMQVRETWEAAAAKLTTAIGSGWTITDGAGGIVTLDISAVVIAGIAPGSYVHDAEWVPGGVEANAVKLWRGTIVVQPEATT